MRHSEEFPKALQHSLPIKKNLLAKHGHGRPFSVLLMQKVYINKLSANLMEVNPEAAKLAKPQKAP